jgi:hypothetical protein
LRKSERPTKRATSSWELTTSRSSGTRRTETNAHAAYRAPNWKFCEFKHGHPSVIFGAPESACAAQPKIAVRQDSLSVTAIADVVRTAGRFRCCLFASEIALGRLRLIASGRQRPGACPEGCGSFHPPGSAR